MSEGAGAAISITEERERRIRTRLRTRLGVVAAQLDASLSNAELEAVLNVLEPMVATKVSAEMLALTDEEANPLRAALLGGVDIERF